MMGMEIDNQTYSNRIRDQNNNGLLCSTESNLHLMNNDQTNQVHQMNLNHHISSHCHLSNQGSAYNVCPSMHNITHLHHQQQDMSSGQSDIHSDIDSPSPDNYNCKLSPSQGEQICYKREAIDSDNY